MIARIKNSLTVMTITALFSGYTVSTGSHAQTHTVEIKLLKFNPEELEVKSGDKVVWVNRDFLIHDVTESDKTWSSDSIPPNGTWSMTVTESAEYFCSIHPIMKGKLIVK